MTVGHAASFGEPWRVEYPLLVTADGKRVATREEIQRAALCVSACEGMADPAAEIARLREELIAVKEEAFNLRKGRELQEEFWEIKNRKARADGWRDGATACRPCNHSRPFPQKSPVPWEQAWDEHCRALAARGPEEKS